MPWVPGKQPGLGHWRNSMLGARWWTDYFCVFWTKFIFTISLLLLKKTDCTTIFFQPLFTIHIQSCGNGRVEARICCPNTAAAQGYQLVLQTHDYREMGRRRQKCIVRWVTTVDQDQGFFSKVRCIILVLILLLPVKGCVPDSQEGSSASFVCKTMLHSKLNS